MVGRIAPGKWRPVAGISLEPNAEEAVRSDHNCLVVAGPGAGKTELLAQRACYLLETGLCPEPRMILAISFKRDAAKNLADRVERRCGKELARRFCSLTYDAFAKSLVDRFMLGLPEDYRPSRDYVIPRRLHKNAFREYTGYLGITLDQFNTLDNETVERNLRKHRLTFDANGHLRLDDLFIANLWTCLIQKLSPSILTFPMISRLAELLLRNNPLLLNALRACYSHVFLDEFQDTTDAQYDLLHTGFGQSSAIVTAVGDSKQRIMGWAGALPQVNDLFIRDFDASRLHLFCNHRSVPALVRMQQVFAYHLEPSSTASVPPVANETDNGVCKVILFDNFEEEASVVAQMIAYLMQKKDLGPRDIVVLARMKVDRYGCAIIEEANALGIRARDESEMQDLLSEPCVDVVVSILGLATSKRDPKSWQEILHLLAYLRGDHPDEAPFLAIEREFQGFLTELAVECGKLENSPSVDGVSRLIQTVFDFIGVEKFKAHYSQYEQGSYFKDTLKKASRYLFSYLSESRDFGESVAAFCGHDSVPIMTIHKSKGLEYDAIFFVGLEDGAFWKYTDQAHEEKCAFFVAFSRAKQRVYFTFSQIRNSGRYGNRKIETHDTIGDLYNLLEKAGAETAEYGGFSTSISQLIE